MKSLLILFGLFAAFGFATAQNGTLVNWAKGFGNSNVEIFGGAKADSSGNVYLAGSFKDTVDFAWNGGVTRFVSANNRPDAFLIKLDPSGTLLWSKVFSGFNSNDAVSAITLDRQQQIVLTGTFSESINLDPGNTNLTLSAFSSEIAAFVCKLDVNGNLIFGKKLAGVNGLNNISAHALSVDSTGNIVLGGRFADTIDFDPGPGEFKLGTQVVTIIVERVPITYSEHSPFVCKLDSLGDFLWVKQINSYYMHVNDLVVEPQGAVIATGDFFETLDFDPGVGEDLHSPVGFASDIFMWKLDTNGDFLWAKTFGGGGTSDDEGNAIGLDGQGNIYLAGVFQSGADFDPGVNQFTLDGLGAYDVFLAKYSSAGDFIWARKTGGTTYDNVSCLEVDFDGNALLTGYFSGTADYDPGAAFRMLTAEADNDVFAMHLDASGNLIWAKNFGGNGRDRGHAITGDGKGNFYFGGLFENAVNFNSQSLNAAGVQTDIFLCKLSSCTASVSARNEDVCEGKPATDGNSYAQSGNYTTSFVALDGCDSLVQTQINVLSNSTNSFLIFACESYTAPDGQLYTTSGVKTAMLTNAKGCDSIISINLFIDPPLLGERTIISCGAFTAPDGQVFASSGTYDYHKTNATGCDSLITLHLTVNEAKFSDLTVSACKNYVAPDGAIYSASGDYAAIIQSVGGCDSTISIHLTIDPGFEADFTVSGNELVAIPVGLDYQWFICSGAQAGIISGANQDTYTIVESNEYGLIADNGVCQDTSACQFVNLVGIQELAVAGEIFVFPNPVQDKITITSEKTLKELRLYNLQGQQIGQWNLEGKKEIEMSCEHWNAGVYFMLVENRNGQQVFRLVKE